MKKIQSERGITLIALAVTIIIITILSVTLITSTNSTLEMKKYNSVKEDILALTEEVKCYYLENGGTLPIESSYFYDVSNILYDASGNPKSDTNPNDGGNYYMIDLDKLPDVALNRGDGNKNKDNTTSDVYVVNEASLTVYYLNGVDLNGQKHYTMVDDFVGGSFAEDYYEELEYPVISAVTMQSNGTERYKAKTGDVITISILLNYEYSSLTQKPILTVNGKTVEVTWNEKIGTAEYTVSTDDADYFDNFINFSIDNYSYTTKLGQVITGKEITEVTFGKKVYLYKIQADGSWNQEKQVNTPKLMTGMTPVYWTDGNNAASEVKLGDPGFDPDEWYDYSSNKWANAKTKDGSYWVWIPRYAYKITSNVGISGETTSGGIDIVFLEGTTNKKGSTEYATTYPTVSSNAMQDYVVHPAFRDGSTTNYMNGEWDKDIPGFWVAKYAAGFQTCTTSASDETTTINGSDTIVYSSKTYSGNDIGANAIGQNLHSSPAMSYPVFKPLTYAYNCIYIGDIYTLTQEIDGKDIDGNAASNASSFYGLSSSQTDSHMMKNSEWGAVAYLTQSNYGRSGTEVSINDKNLKNLNSKNIYAITGYEGTTANGTGASSTNNMSGVFDLNGCVWEYVAGYITNGNSTLTYGSSFANTTANANGYQTLSTKYATVYPYNSSSDSDANNWQQYNSLKSSTYGYGDAVLETSSTDSMSWNGDYSYFAFSVYPFFRRGGYFDDSSTAGTFAFFSFIGLSDIHYGFRAVLVAL